MIASRGVLAALASLALVGSGAATAAAAAREPVNRTQELAVLTSPHRAVSTLGPHPARVVSVRAFRPITGARTVLPVVARTTSGKGVRMLRVLLPGRPNGAKGWIVERGTVPTATRWRLVVKTTSRRVLVYRDGRRVRAFRAIVGKPSTPTPHGRFFVEESVRMIPGSAGAPFALALSARSNVYAEFDGGPGQVALHGVANLGGRPGTAVSHGCVRLANPKIRWLAARLPAGVPVDITP
jgi:lipoprotein-anchoring transpeptidase ErfK/SrfK